MKVILIPIVHFFVTAVKLLRPGGTKAVIAETLLMKHQLMVSNRTRKRSPNLTAMDRCPMGMYSLFIHPNCITKVAKIIKPSTLLKFQQALLVKRKYRLLFSPKRRSKPGPKGSSKELIQAIVEMKTRNPRFEYPRIAQQINHAFGTDINKDVVRRVLAKHYRPTLCGNGPSWLTFIGHMKDSLWSIDLFCCESILLRSHWVLVVMDLYTRRIVGFGVHVGCVDGITLRVMFNKAISRKGSPKYLSTDNDPLYLFHRWQANLRELEIDEIKAVPHVPLSYPFVETVNRVLQKRVIGSSPILERIRSREKAHRLSALLQRTSCAYIASW
jgi:hypothetical protein